MRQRQDEGGTRKGGDDAQDEVALLMRVAAEEMGAFETLYRIYHPRLQRFVRGMIKQSSMA